MGERGDEANVRDERDVRFGIAREDEGGASENDDKCSRNKAAAIQKAAECVFISLSRCVCARVFVVEALFIVSMYQRRFSRMMCIKKKSICVTREFANCSPTCTSCSPLNTRSFQPRPSIRRTSAATLRPGTPRTLFLATQFP